MESFPKAFDAPDPPDVRLPADGVVAVVIAYNERLRLVHFLEHHRAIGVSHFIVIDNASCDGSSEYLDAQPDVTRLLSSRNYREFKARWRHIVADLYLDGRWVLFPDADELFVYPGWPQRNLNDVINLWEHNGYDGVFASMVDMYPAGPIKDATYIPGAPFLDSCPFFDADGYRLFPRQKKSLSEYETPPWDLHGGTRERLVYEPRKRPATSLDRRILREHFHPTRNCDGSSVEQIRDMLLMRYVKRCLPKFPLMMGKVPLLRWRRGIRFIGGVHRIRQKIALAPDWCSLLHFKYLNDLAQKTEEAVERAQHAALGHHYKILDRKKDILLEEGAVYAGSRRFTSVDDLVAVGLMRVSPQTERFLREDERISA